MERGVLDALCFDRIQPSQSYTVQQWRDEMLTSSEDRLAEEVPVALIYNGISHAVMLATPQDLEDFALGFSLTEGILNTASDLYDVDVKTQVQGLELHLTIASEQFARLKERRRSLAGRTGCGLCGAESLSQVFHLPLIQDKKLTEISLKSVLRANQTIRSMQRLQQETGATHACAWANAEGEILVLREDVGRHNALDKLIGTLARQNRTGGFILTTSRASYEMVQKVAVAGFDMLTAVSAPTGLAVRIAEACQITLLGFVRQEHFVAYTHANRLIT